MEPLQTSRSITQNYEEFPEQHKRLLEEAVEKVVQVAQQVGVTPEEIVSLLDSGISIPDLLAFIASKASGVA
jgi:DNA-binding transcriptional regulator YhcF (GntR family)